MSPIVPWAGRGAGHRVGKSARRRFGRRAAGGGLAAVAALAAAVLIAVGLLGAPVASAATSTVGLGTAISFAVLGHTTVTNTGPSAISGNVGVSPGTAIVGFPPGLVKNGSLHAADAVAAQAQLDQNPTAFNDAAGRTPTTTYVTADNQLGGLTLDSGVYAFGGATTANLIGPLTLDGQGDPSAVFIFQASSTLITASNSVVNLIGGAQACNVFWEVGSSATLGTATVFVGTIMAQASATLDTGASLAGRVLASTGAVTLDTNVITAPTCATATATTTTTAPTTATTTAGTTTAGATATTAPAAAASAGGTGGSSAASASPAIVPTGFPHTGAGGASHSTDPVLLALGGLALIGALGATAQAIRRRRTLPAGGSGDDQRP